MNALISRQAAIDAIKRCESSDNYDINDGLIMAMNAVAELPSIELPDHHGDLIEKDALIDVLYHGSKKISEIQMGVKDEKTISYCQGIMVGYANSRIALDGAPVVIPAERSEK